MENKEVKYGIIRTELHFEGDVGEHFSNIKEFLLKNKDRLSISPIKELRRDIPLPIRREVIDRAKGMCEECKIKEGKEIHHILPYAMGGNHTSDNLKLLCPPCHKRISLFNNERRTIKISNKEEVKNLDERS